VEAANQSALASVSDSRKLPAKSGTALVRERPPGLLPRPRFEFDLELDIVAAEDAGACRDQVPDDDTLLETSPPAVSASTSAESSQ
jgi:hypothetical protein